MTICNPYSGLQIYIGWEILHYSAKNEVDQKQFIQKSQLNGGVNTAHYNEKHVFIILKNELEYNNVWIQQRITIEGKLMRIQAWTPFFTSNEETPIVPIQILHPLLPWNCFKKTFLLHLLESIGKVLYLNNSSMKRSSAIMAKAKMQIHLTKPSPRHMLIGLDHDDEVIGTWQPI